MFLNEFDLSQSRTELLLSQISLAHLHLKPHSLKVMNITIRGVSQEQLNQGVCLLNLIVEQTVFDALVVEVSISQIHFSGEISPMFSLGKVP